MERPVANLLFRKPAGEEEAPVVSHAWQPVSANGWRPVKSLQGPEMGPFACSLEICLAPRLWPRSGLYSAPEFENAVPKAICPQFFLQTNRALQPCGVGWPERSVQLWHQERHNYTPSQGFIAHTNRHRQAHPSIISTVKGPDSHPPQSSLLYPVKGNSVRTRGVSPPLL